MPIQGHAQVYRLTNIWLQIYTYIYIHTYFIHLQSQTCAPTCRVVLGILCDRVYTSATSLRRVVHAHISVCMCMCMPLGTSERVMVCVCLCMLCHCQSASPSVCLSVCLTVRLTVRLCLSVQYACVLVCSHVRLSVC